MVILVHGSLAHGSTFSRVVRRLPDLPVVSYDRRGYGMSRESRPAGVLADHVADLLELVGDGPAAVIGHSYGGDVALGAALEAPAVVVAVGAYEPPLPWEQWWPSRTRGGVEEDPARYAEGFFRRMAGDPGAWDRLSERARATLRADGPALVAELTSLRSSPSPFEVRDLAVPAVFARGNDSRWHHRRAAEELHRLVPDSELVDIPFAAHGAHLSHPAAFADFVRKVRQRAR